LLAHAQTAQAAGPTESPCENTVRYRFFEPFLGLGTTATLAAIGLICFLEAEEGYDLAMCDTLAHSNGVASREYVQNLESLPRARNGQPLTGKDDDREWMDFSN
jgi:hypothetical protein